MIHNISAVPNGVANESVSALNINTPSFVRQADPDDAELYEGTGSEEEASSELYRIIPEVNILHIAVTLISVFIVVFGLFSGFIKQRLYVGESIMGVLFGIAMAGYSAQLFAPRTWSEGHTFDETTIEFTRFVVSLSVFACGVELPKAYMLRKARSLAVLLFPVLITSWLICGALIYGLVPGLEFAPSLIVAATIVPTDPVLASSVIGKGRFASENVPAHLRDLLTAESSINDVIAFPLLLVVLFTVLLREERSIGLAFGDWILFVVLYQVILGSAIGIGSGILARKTLKYCKKKDLIDTESMIAMYVALALFVTGATTLCGSDDLTAAFFCGVALAWDDWFQETVGETNFSGTIEMLSNCTMFIYVGATMPFAAFTNFNTTLSLWRLVVLGITVILLRRIPSVMLFYKLMPEVRGPFEALFVGHFGPIGISTIYMATVTCAKLPTPSIPPETPLDTLSLTLQPIAYFLVLTSIMVHGLTIGFFTLTRSIDHAIKHRRDRRDLAQGIVRPVRIKPVYWHSRDDEEAPQDDMSSEKEKADEVGHPWGAPASLHHDRSPNRRRMPVDETKDFYYDDETPPPIPAKELSYFK